MDNQRAPGEADEVIAILHIACNQAGIPPGAPMRRLADLAVLADRGKTPPVAAPVSQLNATAVDAANRAMDKPVQAAIRWLMPDGSCTADRKYGEGYGGKALVFADVGAVQPVAGEPVAHIIDHDRDESIINCRLPIGTAIYTSQPAPVSGATEEQARQDHDEAVLLLSTVFDAWENGDECHEGGDPSASFMGKAFNLDDDVFDRCCKLLNRLNPPRNAPAGEVVSRPAPGGWRLVPIALTQEMIDAWNDSRADDFKIPDVNVSDYTVEQWEAWKKHNAELDWVAMLAAAPLPPTQEPT